MREKLTSSPPDTPSRGEAWNLGGSSKRDEDLGFLGGVGWV